jgi:hypothetical protein
VTVSNLPNTSRDVTASLNLEAMGLSGASVEDAITGEAVEINDNVITLDILPQRWRLLKVWVN